MTELGPRRARRGNLVPGEDLPRQESRTGAEAGTARWERIARAEHSLRAAPSRPSGIGGWSRWLALPVGCLLLAGWAACCVVPAQRWSALATVVVLLAAIAPLTAVAAVPLATVAVRRRRWFCAGAAVLAGLFPWWFALGYAASSDAAVPAGGSVVHLMIVDARQGQANAADVVAAVAGGRADLLVVTELSGTLAHDLTAAGLDSLVQARSVQLPGQGLAPDVPEAGLGVWSRFPVDGVQPISGTTWPALTARVVADGAGFTLITGHVAPPMPDGGVRWAQDLAALRATAAGVQAGGGQAVASVAAGSVAGAASVSGPVVLLGNLNATPWHADFRLFAAAGLQDAGDSLGQGLRPTWPTWSPIPLLPLDHALVGGGVRVEAVDTVIIGGTDHRALLVTLRIPRSS